MSTANREILTEAIARNCGVVVSLPSAGLMRHYKSRFLAEQLDGFWVESVPGEDPLITELLGNRNPVGISFRNGTNKVVFAVPLLRREPSLAINANTTLDALLFALPESVKLIQRRNNYRVRITPDSGLALRVWRIAPRVMLDQRPPAAAELQLDLHDISVGGLGVTFKATEEGPPKFSSEDRLRIELTFADSVLLLEGQARVASGSGREMVRTGVLLRALERDLEGRQKLSQLNRIVGELQREEIRRCRLGMAS